MQAIYDVLAPAKLNLFLHITDRRADGLHQLQSVFVLLDWCDILHFELRGDGQINRIDLNAQAPLPAVDLVVRAARALQEVTGTHWGVNIALDKRLPMQAGLGGGSSDAASCLLALQRLWGVRLSPERLLVLAQSLGADVPFFLCGSHAWVEGIGERVTPVELAPAHFVVVHPGVGLSTQTVFHAPQLVRNTPIATWADFKAGGFDFGHNDLQPVAVQLCPEVGQCLEWLDHLGLHGRMTGSGSAVFARTSELMGLVDVPNGWVIRPCSALEKHPLVGW